MARNNDRAKRAKKLELLVKELYELDGKKNVQHDVIIRGRQIDVCFSECFTKYFVEVKHKQNQGIVDYRYITGFMHLLQNFGVDVDQGIMITDGWYDIESRKTARDNGLILCDRFDLEKLCYGKLGFFDRRKAVKLWKKVDKCKQKVTKAEIDAYVCRQNLGEPAKLSQRLKKKCFGNHYRKKIKKLRKKIGEYQNMMEAPKENLDEFYRENKILTVEEYIDKVVL